ncbi:hypothetical protein [Congregicoccus parvus]|uniref:hypothetical protein n=1 Tax=Congregicoccus parvus TaxID=3081749 RepID=UPI003FA60DBF
MDDREAIAAYNDVEERGRLSRFPGVLWPDLNLDRDNLRRLVEGVLEERLDLVGLAFGDDIDRDALADRVEEAWRMDEMQVRFAPEGVSIRFACTVRVALGEAEGEGEEHTIALGGDSFVDLEIAGALCLSFVARLHTRPFIDFMGGTVAKPEERGAGTPPARQIDPFTLLVSPQLAIGWGLNDVSTD